MMDADRLRLLVLVLLIAENLIVALFKTAMVVLMLRARHRTPLDRALVNNMASLAVRMFIMCGLFVVALVPGLAIVITVLSLNVLGDGLRDALDPRAKVRLR